MPIFIIQTEHLRNSLDTKCKQDSIFTVCKSVYHHIYSNKSTNQMHQSFRLIASRINTAQHVLGILMHIIKSLSTAVAASGLPSERDGSSVVGRGRSGKPARPRPTALLPPLSNGKPEAATTVYKLLMMGKTMPGAYKLQ
jgi:hypothetical protein